MTSVYAVDTFFLLLSICYISITQLELAVRSDIFDVTFLTLSRAVVISDRIMKRAFSPLSFSYNGNMIEQINNFLIYAPYFGSIQRGEICICSIVEDEDGRNLYRRDYFSLQRVMREGGNMPMRKMENGQGLLDEHQY